MNPYQKLLPITLISLAFACGTPTSASDKTDAEAPISTTSAASTQKIMLALLLDTSNSMDGLIEQAKSQLWTIVNELSAAKCDNGERPEVKIALYEYGNDRLPHSEGYIRMVTDLTSDLDLLSKNLFELTTNGGSEFCGFAIQNSVMNLEWSASDADLKMIFIAGNEPFTQGQVPYVSACKDAKERGIVVNTIFCGNFQEGIRTSWKHGADLTGGSYTSIAQDHKTVYISTPFDAQIDSLNEMVNKTYIHYGRGGSSRLKLQKEQDDNAASYSRENKVKRTISKSSSVYKNTDWDLVDAMEANEEVLDEVEMEYLPDEIKGMDKGEVKAYVEAQAERRKQLNAEIHSLGAKRRQYISTHQSKEVDGEAMLDQAMIQSIRQKASDKNLTFE